MRYVIVAALCFLATLATAQDTLTITVAQTDAAVTVKTTVETCTSVEGVTLGCSEKSTTAPATVTPIGTVKVGGPVGIRLRLKSRTAIITSAGSNVYSVATPGTHIVEVLGIGIIDGKLFFDEQDVTVVVGVAPEPGPPPGPEPIPAPIPVAGFHVLFVAESSTLPSLPQTQLTIFYSQEMRAWLDQNTTAWRYLDPNVVIPVCDEVWCPAMKRPRTSTPWIIVSNGVTGYEGPLPITVTETIKLIEQYK